MENNVKSRIDCKTCQKPFKCILQHLKKSKSCAGTYTQEEMDHLNKISKDISGQKLAGAKMRYYQRNKEKIGESMAKYYLKNKDKKYEKGIGQSLVKELYDVDFQKYKAAKEWVDILKPGNVSIDFLKHVCERLKYSAIGFYHYNPKWKMMPVRL